MVAKLNTSCAEQEELIQKLTRRNEEETSFNLLALDGLICLSFLMYVSLPSALDSAYDSPQVSMVSGLKFPDGRRRISAIRSRRSSIPDSTSPDLGILHTYQVCVIRLTKYRSTLRSSRYGTTASAPDTCLCTDDGQLSSRPTPSRDTVLGISVSPAPAGYPIQGRGSSNPGASRTFARLKVSPERCISDLHEFMDRACT